MNASTSTGACGTRDHLTRRTLLKSSAGGLAWLTPLASILAREAEAAADSKAPAKSVIMLYLAGGLSQLESFDPHPGTVIGGEVKAIKTRAPEIQLADTLPALAEVMDEISLVRSVFSKEGDHERATYNFKTGNRPVPGLVHPAIGSVVCHESSAEGLDIPRHISILANQWAARGGYLGSRYDAFRVGDPAQRIPDVNSRVDDERTARRMKGLEMLEKNFASGRHPDLESHTLHQTNFELARKMMTSDQLKAFDVNEASASERKAYGGTAFGRGCMAAARLIEVGVRCVEVTLGGFDTHINNHELQSGRLKILDTAYAALIRDLKQRGLLDSTIVVCGSEFGRTPKINPAGGRDHWPHGFTVALAGGGFRGGRVVGSTDPEGAKKEPERPISVEDIHATIHHRLGVNYRKQYDTPADRPIRISEGKIVEELS